MTLVDMLKLIAVLGFTLEHTPVPEDKKAAKREMNETLMSLFAELVARSGDDKLKTGLDAALDEAIAEAKADEKS